MSARHHLHATQDRLHEAHWFLHQMDLNYHQANPFRYSLNAFLRALKEVPQIIKMELQNVPGFSVWFEPHANQLSRDPLLSLLRKKRDFVVHQGMFLPVSRVTVGLSKWGKFKLGLGLDLDPLEDSDTAMICYLHTVAEGGSDVLDILRDDDDTAPCVWRTWRIEQFKDDELVDLVAKAWTAVANVVVAALEWQQHPSPNRDLSCRHGSEALQSRTYDRARLRQLLTQIKEEKRK